MNKMAGTAVLFTASIMPFAGFSELIALSSSEASLAARTYITNFNRVSAYPDEGLGGKSSVLPLAFSRGDYEYVILGSQDDLSDLETDWQVVRLGQGGTMCYADISTNEADLLYAATETFVLNNANGERSYFFSRNDSIAVQSGLSNALTTSYLFEDSNGDLRLRLEGDGGLSLFRSPDFVSIEVCSPWILKGTNAIVEKAAVIPALTNRVIACSDKPGAVATYRDARALSGTNVTGAVLAVFFDVNRDGDCDAYLTDGARSIGGGTNEWSLVLHGTNGWTLAESDFVSTNEVATGEDLPLFAGGRPYTSPRTLVAATNDFFAVSKLMWWHSSEYLEIGAPEIEVSDPRGLNKLEKLPCETFDSP